MRPDRTGRFHVVHHVEDGTLRETLAARPRTVSMLSCEEEVVDGHKALLVAEHRFTFKLLPYGYMAMLDQWLAKRGYRAMSQE